ncbi:MAG: agmatine deiminase family protein, partial [Bacteroidales bacterium]|nr:agmatine deiminase family protein [Bacteroidales bacterium]
EEYGIQHIDCYAKFLDEETIMVKQVDDWHPEYACCEDLANKLSTESNCWGEPYHIIRIYCGSYNGTEVAAYTNSLILNKKVLVPQFDINSDETALQTYEEAMPGYEVIGFEWNAWYYYDALHCRTMGIFDRHMLRIVHKPVKGDISVAGQLQIVALIDDRSEAGLAEDELKLHWRTAGSAIWNDMIMMPVPATVDSFYSYIPDPEVGETYEYYVSASDQSGRFVTCPRTAPDNHIAFTVTDISTSTDRPKPHEILSVKPSVFSNKTHIHYAGLGAANISLYSIQGEKIREWQTTGETTILWQGDDEQGKSCAGGLYIIKLADMFQEDYLKCILVR